MNADKNIIKQQEDKAREFIKTLGLKREFNPFTGEAQAEINRLESELSKQKAITELAVKGLKEIRDYEIQWFDTAVTAMKSVSSSTISEIEKEKNTWSK